MGWLRATMAMTLLVACTTHPTPVNAPAGPPTPASVPSARLERLRRAVNVTRWFWLPENGGSPAHFAGYLGAPELASLRQAGILTVRLVVAPKLLLRLDAPGTPKPEIQLLDAAIDRILAQDLGVVLDLQDDDKAAWETKPDYVTAMLSFWTALATRYAAKDPERMFFEILNEPRFEGRGSDWSAIQARFVTTLRGAAPSHTLIVTGSAWGGIDGLLALAPVADANVVYSFHFYEPFPFTHQGATWADPGLADLHGVPYPVTGAACEAAVAQAKTEAARGTLRKYCAEGWSAEKIRDRLTRVRDWAALHHVHVWMGEFGAYCKDVDPSARVAWIRDTASAADALGIGWALWGYDDCFGLGRKREGERTVIDAPVARALGLGFR